MFAPLYALVTDVNVN